MVRPNYYWRILEHIEANNLITKISFTTNLWDFYLHPEKWTALFQHERVGVTTSFNYGETRRVSKSKNFTEDLFWKVSDKFSNLIGYRPDFISVVNDQNESTALDNVLLAKKMNVECKLNYAMASGRESRPYQLSKIYQIYLEIIKNKLTPWEFNTKELIKGINKRTTICPRNRTCDSGIRCIQPSGDYYSCGAFGDDHEHSIDFDQEMNDTNISTPLSDNFELSSLKMECFGCPMFEICNGCHKTISDLKRFNMVESHCQLMKQLEKEICLLGNDFNLFKVKEMDNVGKHNSFN